MAYEQDPMAGAGARGGLPDPAAAGAPGGAEESPMPMEQGGEGGETATIPESLCPGMKEGDEIVLKIVGKSDGQYQVAYAPAEGGGEKGEEGPSWEEDFRKEMSPQEPQSQPM